MLRTSISERYAIDRFRQCDRFSSFPIRSSNLVNFLQWRWYRYKTHPSRFSRNDDDMLSSFLNLFASYLFQNVVIIAASYPVNILHQVPIFYIKSKVIELNPSL